MEPFKLRRWKQASSTDRLAFYTCARPGRSRGPNGQVADGIVHKWLQGLPDEEKVAVVSLLGRKPDGTSEFAFYSFSGAWDTPEERRGRPSFAEWVARSRQSRPIKVVEHPTEDFKPIPPETLAAIANDVLTFLEDGWTVILVDSGGETRNRRVCSHLRFVEDSRRP